MKMSEVRVIAKNLGINSFGMSKAELIKEIQRKQGNFDCYGSAGDYCGRRMTLLIRAVSFCSGVSLWRAMY